MTIAGRAAELDLAELTGLAGGRIGVHDVACPMCGPDRRAAENRIRRVLRIWLIDDRFATWSCARCGSKGEALAFPQPSGNPESDDALKQKGTAREASRVHEQQSAAERLKVAHSVWRRRRPLRGTVVETYLREVRGCRGPLPATLGFLPPRGNHPPAMIAPFGLPAEPEPGRLEIELTSVQGVHITRLLPNGSGKVPDRAKIMIGRCLGSPIVLAPMNDGLGLAITEGIEDALSIHEATGLGVWAAGAASRLPALAASVPPYAAAVTVIADADPAGERFAAELRSALADRQITAETAVLAEAA